MSDEGEDEGEGSYDPCEEGEGCYEKEGSIVHGSVSLWLAVRRQEGKLQANC